MDKAIERLAAAGALLRVRLENEVRLLARRTTDGDASPFWVLMADYDQRVAKRHEE